MNIMDHSSVNVLQPGLGSASGCPPSYFFGTLLLDRSDTWWKYDGMWEFGVPRPDHVEDDAGLLINDGWSAAYLVY